MTSVSRSTEPVDDGAQFVRVAERERAAVAFTLDGRPAQALAGDTVLTAIDRKSVV